jgi:putative ABC transport system ATP-binding protein
MEPAISIRNVDHFFGMGDLRKQVLYDISMDIQPGEIVILTGPSGSGKTTILTLVGALRRLEHGSIKVFGKEMKDATQENMVRLRQQIGFIFQQHNLLGALTARENVLMSLGANGPPKWGSRKVCVEVLKSVGLGDRLHHTPRQLSGGQRQRVAIARALVRKPRIILADEPTAALDKQSGREVVELLQALAREQQCTILLVTHDNRILDVADRILTLEDGRLTSFTAGMVANTGHLLTAFSKLQRQGDLASHMKELSDKQFLELLEQVTGEFEQFLSVVSLGNSDAVSAMFDQVLEAVTQRIRILLSADRATLFLVDERRKLLVSRLADMKPGQFMTIEVPINQGIAGRVAATGEPLNVPDPYHHPAFNPDIDRQTGYRTRSILCMPLVNRERRVFAVAQLLNRIDADAFTEQDERRFLEFTEPVSVILEGCIRVSQSVS